MHEVKVWKNDDDDNDDDDGHKHGKEHLSDLVRTMTDPRMTTI